MWDYDLNSYNPKDISCMSHYKMYFKCKYGKHQSTLIDLTTLCNMNIELRCRGCNSIGEYIITNYGKDFLDKVWSDRNKISPYGLNHATNQKMWWKSLVGEPDIYYSVNEMKKAKFARLHRFSAKSSVSQSGLQKNVAKYINDLGYLVKHEYDCSLKPINPKTNRVLPFDNLVEELKLVIEVHGSQHYYISTWDYLGNNNLSPKERFQYRVWKDNFKKEYALEHGYHYLEIPYYTQNKSLYKKLINDKIKQIKNFKP